MQITLSSCVRQRITDYLAGTVTLRQLEGSLASDLWDVDRDAEPEATFLWGQVTGRTAEYDLGAYTEEELRDLFDQLLAPSHQTASSSVSIPAPADEPTGGSTSSASNVPSRLRAA